MRQGRNKGVNGCLGTPGLSECRLPGIVETTRLALCKGPAQARGNPVGHQALEKQRKFQEDVLDSAYHRSPGTSGGAEQLFRHQRPVTAQHAIRVLKAGYLCGRLALGIDKHAVRVLKAGYLCGRRALGIDMPQFGLSKLFSADDMRCLLCFADPIGESTLHCGKWKLMWKGLKKSAKPRIFNRGIGSCGNHYDSVMQIAFLTSSFFDFAPPRIFLQTETLCGGFFVLGSWPDDAGQLDTLIIERNIREL